MYGSQMWNAPNDLRKSELTELGEYVIERQLKSQRRLSDQNSGSHKRLIRRPRTGG